MYKNFFFFVSHIHIQYCVYNNKYYKYYQNNNLSNFIPLIFAICFALCAIYSMMAAINKFCLFLSTILIQLIY